MSWAKVKKTSLDHVKKTSSQMKLVEGEQNKTANEEMNGIREEAEEGNDTFDETGDSSQRRGSASWTNVHKKITPTARFSVGKISRDENWIVEERLKSNFYLDDVEAKLAENLYMDDGVSKWHIIHPIANGKRQSPIDIETGKAKLDKTLKPLDYNYGKGCVKAVVNTGNSFKVDVDDKLTSLVGGALSDEYRLIQFHAHWGTTAGAKGSEHTVNGKLYDAELHLVHWNTKYGLFTNAVSKPDGLAVVGVFLEVGNEDHPEFEKVLSVFDDIYFKNQKTNYSKELSIDPAKFLPSDMSYWHYEGSLTTPPLDESVMWHVLRTPITISKNQLDTMAALRTGTDKSCVSCIINNFRPPLPVGDRDVRLFTGEAVEMSKRTEENQEVNKIHKNLVEEVMSLKNVISELQLEVKNLKGSLQEKQF